MSVLFLLVPLFVIVFIILIFTFVITMFVKAFTQWAADNKCPIETIEARVITKRQQVSGSSQPNMPGSTSTWYYCTFEFQNGERKEYSVGGPEYGMLAEGDYGILTFQGSRYKGFQRGRQDWV